MTVYRWVFDDMVSPTPDTYTVPINPNTMTKIRGARQITSRTTTAVLGQTLMFEGNRGPGPFQFGGVLLSKAHYLALDEWTYEKGRIKITDHLLRKLYVVLQDFDATPKRSALYPWRHNYQVTGLIYDVDFTGSLA